VTRRYVAGILILGAAGAAGMWAARDRLEPGGLAGLFLGLALATAGALSWIGAAVFSIERGQQAFMAAMVLGILGRLMIYGAALIYVALRTTIDPVFLAGSLLGFYVIFLVLEVRFAVKALRRSGGHSGVKPHGG